MKELYLSYVEFSVDGNLNECLKFILDRRGLYHTDS